MCLLTSPTPLREYAIMLLFRVQSIFGTNYPRVGGMNAKPPQNRTQTLGGVLLEKFPRSNIDCRSDTKSGQNGERELSGMTFISTLDGKIDWLNM